METSWRIFVVLAQTEGREGKLSDLHIWLALVVGLGFALGVIGYLVIKKVKAAQETDDEEAPFSLSELRRMYEAGEVALEEYEHMRSNMIAAVKASLGEEIKVETAQSTASPESPKLAEPPETNEPTETEELKEKDGLGHLVDPLDESADTDSPPDHSVENTNGEEDDKDNINNEGEGPNGDEERDEDDADDPRVQ